jgi:hypothetical protein
VLLGDSRRPSEDGDIRHRFKRRVNPACGDHSTTSVNANLLDDGIGRPKEIGIAPEVLGRRERDRIDPLFDYDVTGGRKPGDPMRERFDEIVQRLRGLSANKTPLPGAA